MRMARAALGFVSSLLAASCAFAQTGNGQPGAQQPEFVRQAQDLLSAGKLEQALDVYRKELEASPNSLPANNGAGSVLDLMGRGEDARKYFTKAIDAADTPERKASAERAMAISYAFEGNCNEAAELEKKVFDFYASQNNFFQEGEIADEAARICLDAGVLDTAAKWYALGHDSGMQEPGMTPARRDLWEFRWEHAQARIAARRGARTEAHEHMKAAKAALDRGTNPEQAAFYPYLAGYVAFYADEDYKAALAAFTTANQKDPFIQCLMAQSYEKLGEREQAMQLYRKAAAATSHNPPAAYTVPFSKYRLAKLGGAGSSQAVIGGSRLISPPKPPAVPIPEAIEPPPAPRGGESPLTLPSFPRARTGMCGDPKYFPGAVSVLTPTQGVDLGPYLDGMVSAVKRAWYANMPISARMGAKGCVVVQFSVNRDGSVSPVILLVESSGSADLDNAAFSGIRTAAPFNPLPAEFKGPSIELRFVFFYNHPKPATTDTSH